MYTDGKTERHADGDEYSINILFLSTVLVSHNQSFPPGVKVQSEESVTHLSTISTESTTVHFNGRPKHLHILLKQYFLTFHYSCGLSTATIEYSSLSVCLSVCLSVYTITQKIMVQLT